MDGIKESYSIGSYVEVNCTSSPSHPPARMAWYINGAKVRLFLETFTRSPSDCNVFQAQQWLIDHYYIEQPGNKLELETRTIGLKFQTDHAHFLQRKDKSLSLVCSSTVADRTRSTEIKAYLSKLTKEKFAQHFRNSCSGIIPNLYILIMVIIFN